MFASADQAVESYLRLRHRLSAPQAARLSVSMGTAYAAACARCGGVRRVPLSTRRGTDMRCARCGAVWPREEVEVPAGAVQASRRGVPGPEGALAALGTLTAALERVPPPSREVLLAYVGFAGPGARHERLAADLGLTPSEVRRRLRVGREALELHLRCAGLLAASEGPPG